MSVPCMSRTSILRYVYHRSVNSHKSLYHFESLSLKRRCEVSLRCISHLRFSRNYNILIRSPYLNKLCGLMWLYLRLNLFPTNLTSNNVSNTSLSNNLSLSLLLNDSIHPFSLALPGSIYSIFTRNQLNQLRTIFVIDFTPLYLVLAPISLDGKTDPATSAATHHEWTYDPHHSQNIPYCIHPVSWVTWFLSDVALRLTMFRRYVYVTGGNKKVARLSGIKTSRINVFVYMISSFFASLTGIILASRMGMENPLVGERYMLDWIIPVVIGVMRLTGWSDVMGGTTTSVPIFSILSNALNLIDVSAYWQRIVDVSW